MCESVSCVMGQVLSVFQALGWMPYIATAVLLVVVGLGIGVIRDLRK